MSTPSVPPSTVPPASITSKSTLQIRELTPEDIPTYQDLRHLSFQHTMNKILYADNSGQYSPSTRSSVIAATESDMLSKKATFLGCFHPDGTMIAGARWRFIGLPTPLDSSGAPQVRTMDHVTSELSIQDAFPESDVGIWNSFFGQMHYGIKEHMGTRPYVCLDTLITHPGYRRLGAGKMLVEWGTERADKAGLETYLLATGIGEKLYLGLGFEGVGGMEVEAGGEKIEFVHMIRPANTKK
ncbi:acyl-CoA N-acyltransferase [Lophiostoma macrostomum CBS 122681]|uniref:Acyl-CoA N-acyltransferase n=1 Tax=Lophiostoma macrostomum CBS 122681 TaxID=1314788 RepID=A0A6A6STN9_9PLEO|nr:acyl-CoA N-acyltransferase [Lophiostoma macrostomum CBS 122681]